MKIEELELIDKILPENSLWNILEIGESKYYKDQFEILLDHQGIRFQIDFEPDLKISRISINAQESECLYNCIEIFPNWRGFYTSLERYFTVTPYNGTYCIDAMMTLIKATGGPVFVRVNEFKMSLLNQSNTFFVPTPHNIRIEQTK